ncbi:ABC transporter-like [Syntrophomonas zehnderi OL-4]|uniref:ABC transporter-like n=1 Tax=Syntrophomonas zehnderi OL-4 TaxID=690567 RepID=A0A0E4G900_9FIRM|nr:ABC transporter ATP-binding protein [Syntrophomonas zehnderi]CFX01788.1 ABC transporter-like [Syntrophomonas zehnderi OL-4]
MIKCVGLSKRFGYVQALDEVSLHIAKGDVFGLVGPDGAGKTTFIRTVCGLITPDKGTIWLAGAPPDRPGKTSQNLGYMPQRFSLYGDLTVMENVIFFGSMYGLSKKTIIARAEEILAITGMLDFKKRLADQLSGGMKQKLALTTALITRPEILILDEPTYGVDPESRHEFWKILYSLNQTGITILVSTPYMDEAELCSRVAFINAGQIKAVDSPAGLRQAFGHKLLELRIDSRDPHILNGVPGLLDVSFYGYKYLVVVDDIPTARSDIAFHLARLGISTLHISEAAPTMEDVFVALAEGGTD